MMVFYTPRELGKVVSHMISRFCPVRRISQHLPRTDSRRETLAKVNRSART